jgi:hypothetical protein
VNEFHLSPGARPQANERNLSGASTSFLSVLHPVLGHFASILSMIKAACEIARSTMYTFVGLRLSDSMSINLRAQSSVAAKRIACLRSSVMGNSALGCGRGEDAILQQDGRSGWHRRKSGFPENSRKLPTIPLTTHYYTVIISMGYHVKLGALPFALSAKGGSALLFSASAMSGVVPHLEFCERAPSHAKVSFAVMDHSQFNLSPLIATHTRNRPATPLECAHAHHSEKSALITFLESALTDHHSTNPFIPNTYTKIAFYFFDQRSCLCSRSKTICLASRAEMPR